MKRIGVLTSGGDAPGMNAAIRAVVRAAGYYEMSVVGFKSGYNGTLMYSKDASDDYIMMTNHSVSNRVHTGGTFLRTARCLDFHREEIQKRAISNMRLLGLEGLIVIGGDGSLTGASALNRLGFPTVGIPGTIDNDLAYTDFTLGFDTALNTACECINRIRDTSESHERATIITVMGRHCGEIAVHTALDCGAEIALVPEVPWTIEEIAGKMKWAHMRGKRSTIIILAEGAMESLTTNVPELCAQYPELADVAEGALTGSRLAKILEVISGQETRNTVLGYIQRGGSPSALDRRLGAQFGTRAVELLKENISGVAVGIRNNTIVEVPYEEVIGVKRPVNEELKRLITILSNS